MTFTMVREQWAVFNRVGFSSTESARGGAFHYHDYHVFKDYENGPFFNPTLMYKCIAMVYYTIHSNAYLWMSVSCMADSTAYRRRNRHMKALNLKSVPLRLKLDCGFYSSTDLFMFNLTTRIFGCSGFVNILRNR